MPCRDSINRWAVALAYLTDVLFARTVVSMGLSCRQEDAKFSASEASDARAD